LRFYVEPFGLLNHVETSYTVSNYYIVIDTQEVKARAKVRPGSIS